MELKLVAERREGTGKGVARKLRAAGKIPAVLYGQGLETTPLTVDSRELSHLLHGSAIHEFFNFVQVDYLSFFQRFLHGRGASHKKSLRPGRSEEKKVAGHPHNTRGTPLIVAPFRA